MSRRCFAFVLATVIALLTPAVAHAWLRASYEDAQVVDPSTLIVVAHLKPGSLQYVDTSADTPAAHSWNYRATLVISQTLKGKPQAQEIPITLFYGIEALVEGKVQHDGGGQESGTFPKDSIQLLDYADFAPVICKDATQDNLWLMQQRARLSGGHNGRRGLWHRRSGRNSAPRARVILSMLPGGQFPGRRQSLSATTP